MLRDIDRTVIICHQLLHRAAQTFAMNLTVTIRLCRVSDTAMPGSLFHHRQPRDRFTTVTRRSVVRPRRARGPQRTLVLYRRLRRLYLELMVPNDSI